MAYSGYLRWVGWLLLIHTVCTNVIASDDTPVVTVSKSETTNPKDSVEKPSQSATADDEASPDDMESDEYALLKRYGAILGSGLLTGKRDSPNGDVTKEESGPAYYKRWFGDIYGGGYNLYDRNRRDAERETPDKRFIRYFGNVLGGGFTVGKRDGSNEAVGDDAPNGFYVPEGIEYINPTDGNQGDGIDDVKRYIDSTPGYRFLFGKRGESPDSKEKRYFNSDVGARFLFRKRSSDESEMDKRYGFLLGKGFSFGKRKYDRRPFGHVLGSGFSFGKRTSGEDNNVDADTLTDGDIFIVPNGLETMDMGDNKWLVGRGWKMDKRDNSKRWGWVLGRGRLFGKRSSDGPTQSPDGVYFMHDNGDIEIPDKRYIIAQGYNMSGGQSKRYGHVLGSGFTFGKRGMDLDENTVNPSDEGFMMDKRYGFLLGRGFAFGKRLPPKKTYGILGR